MSLFYRPRCRRQLFISEGAKCPEHRRSKEGMRKRLSAVIWCQGWLDISSASWSCETGSASEQPLHRQK